MTADTPQTIEEWYELVLPSSSKEQALTAISAAINAAYSAVQEAVNQIGKDTPAGAATAAAGASVLRLFAGLTSAIVAAADELNDDDASRRTASWVQSRILIRTLAQDVAGVVVIDSIIAGAAGTVVVAGAAVPTVLIAIGAGTIAAFGSDVLTEAFLNILEKDFGIGLRSSVGKSDIPSVAYTYATGGIFYFVGSNEADLFTTSNETAIIRVLTGNGGGDTLTGSNSRDSIDGGSGEDSLDARGGDDWIQGGGGSDIIKGGNGINSLYGDDASGVSFTGKGGDDVIEGGDNFDYIYGQEGNDFIICSGDDDFAYGDGLSQDDQGNKWAGADTIYGCDGSDWIYGHKGNDELYGGAGDDKLVGGDDVDILDGGAGSDNLDGGDGDGTYTGGEGADSFKVSKTDTSMVSDLGKGEYVYAGTSLLKGAIVDEGEDIKDSAGNVYEFNGNTSVTIRLKAGGTVTVYAGEDGVGTGDGSDENPWQVGSIRGGQRDKDDPDDKTPTLPGDIGYNRLLVADPLVLDLDGDGVELTALAASGVRFDLDGDGFAEATGWVSGDDGLLAVDANGNGAVDGVAELFGDTADVPDGYTKLDGYDSNHDGQVDSRDDQWLTLSLWHDANADGVTQAGELESLDEAGVTTLYLLNQGAAVSQAGNTIDRTGGYQRNGVVYDMAEVWFATDPRQSQAANPLADWSFDGDQLRAVVIYLNSDIYHRTFL